MLKIIRTRYKLPKACLHVVQCFHVCSPVCQPLFYILIFSTLMSYGCFTGYFIKYSMMVRIGPAFKLHLEHKYNCQTRITPKNTADYSIIFIRSLIYILFMFVIELKQSIQFYVYPYYKLQWCCIFLYRFGFVVFAS